MAAPASQPGGYMWKQVHAVGSAPNDRSALSQIKRYLGRPIGSEPPHIYAIADRMYRLLLSSRESQASAFRMRYCGGVLRYV